MDSRKRILLVDDEVSLTEVVKALLEKNDYEVLTVNNGHAAIETSKVEQPDLILMDLNMPGMDGFTAASVIRADRATAHIPILMLTVDDTIENISKAYTLKLNGYVIKSLMSAVLIDRIGEVLSQNRNAE